MHPAYITLKRHAAIYKLIYIKVINKTPFNVTWTYSNGHTKDRIKSSPCL
jgi:hypothetical protein